jgi:hypothetical protein
MTIKHVNAVVEKETEQQLHNCGSQLFKANRRTLSGVWTAPGFVEMLKL